MNINEEVCSCEGPHALCHPEALGLQTGGATMALLSSEHVDGTGLSCRLQWAPLFKSMFSSLLPPAQTHELSLLACVFSPHTVQE